MRTRPFLSHRRADRAQVIALKKVLALYGVGGWRDLDDLQLGELGQAGFETAINHVTGGFLWYGTKRVLDSWYVNNVELPVAIARKRREPDYPIVPLFATVRPAEANAKLLDVARDPTTKLTVADHRLFFDANGYAREPRQYATDFRTEVARRYVRTAVKWLANGGYTVAISALTEPAGTQDFTFDWRALVNPRTRVLATDAEHAMRDGLLTLRDAIRPTAAFPVLTLDCDAPLPMAAFVGYEWRVTSRLKLRINQRTRSGTISVDGDGAAGGGWPAWTERPLAHGNATVVAVATTEAPLTAPLERYAREVGAARTYELHVPHELDAAEVRGLARHTAQKLRELANEGTPRHLLLAGPSALAVLIGAAANAAGAIVIPLWNGSSYGSTVTIGG